MIALVFSLVALNFTDATGLERQIAADLRRNHHYHIIQVVPYGIEVPPIGQGTYIIWQYQASTRQKRATRLTVNPAAGTRSREHQLALEPRLV